MLQHFKECSKVPELSSVDSKNFYTHISSQDGLRVVKHFSDTLLKKQLPTQSLFSEPTLKC